MVDRRQTEWEKHCPNSLDLRPNLRVRVTAKRIQGPSRRNQIILSLSFCDIFVQRKKNKRNSERIVEKKGLVFFSLVPNRFPSFLYTERIEEED